jgi:hypothetical protein
LGEKVLANPVFGPAIFNGGGVVGFGQVVGHGVFSRAPRGLRGTLFREGFLRGDHPSLYQMGVCGIGMARGRGFPACSVFLLFTRRGGALIHDGISFGNFEHALVGFV